MWRMTDMLFVVALTLMIVSNVTSSCCTQSGQTLTCRNCNLTSEPVNVTDDTITDVILQDDKILKLPSEAILATESLKRLTLADSPLLSLDADAFEGMKSVLSFESQILGISTLLPAGIFSPFKNLRQLRLFHVYPTHMANNTLDVLPNLEFLAMQMAPHSVLGDEFSAMTKLMYLHIIGFHRTPLISMTRETFSAIPHLETLQISGGLVTIMPDALRSLPKLSTLALPCNWPLSIKQVTNAITRQTKAVLKKLVLDYAAGDRDYSLNSGLFNSTKFNKLTHLSLRHTFMAGFDPDFLCYVLPKLQYISVETNRLFASNNWQTNNFHNSLNTVLKCAHHGQIQTVDISYTSNIFGPYFENNACAPLTLVDGYFRKPPTTSGRHQALNQTVIKVDSTLENTALKNIPPSLQYIFLDHVDVSSHFEGSSYFSDENNIAFIDISHSDKTYIGLSKGLNKLQGVDASYSNLNGWHPDQYFYMPSLNYVNLAHNKLAHINLTRYLAGGSTLQWLDLSYNGFREIPTSCLFNLTSIRYLSFQGNPITDIQVNLENNTKLHTLNLSSCLLESLDKYMIHQLDSLQSKINHTLHLDISNNKFHCCKSLDMIQWFSTTKVNISSKPDIKCSFMNQSMHIMDADVGLLERECSKREASLVLIIVSLIVIAFVIVITATMVYQLRWQLRLSIYQLRWHLRWYIYRLKWYIRSVCSRPDDELSLEQIGCQYDVFVSYSHERDWEWVQGVLVPKVEHEWGLRLCIGERGFIPGTPIAENICDAVYRSNRTILIITPGFVASAWCEFGMQVALTRGLQNLIIIYKEEVPTWNMSKTLMFLMKSPNSIEYNDSPDGSQMFWRKLHTWLVS